MHSRQVWQVTIKKKPRRQYKEAERNWRGSEEIFDLRYQGLVKHRYSSGHGFERATNHEFLYCRLIVPNTFFKK